MGHVLMIAFYWVLLILFSNVESVNVITSSSPFVVASPSAFRPFHARLPPGGSRIVMRPVDPVVPVLRQLWEPSPIPFGTMAPLLRTEFEDSSDDLCPPISAVLNGHQIATITPQALDEEIVAIQITVWDVECPDAVIAGLYDAMLEELAAWMYVYVLTEVDDDLAGLMAKLGFAPISVQDLLNLPKRTNPSARPFDDLPNRTSPDVKFWMNELVIS